MTAPLAPALLRATDLVKRYGDRTAVAGVSLTLAAGEILGLLGPNGAGKTTTISILTGVVTPDAGAVAIAGHDLRAAPRRAKRALGLVPQELALYDELSPLQNLRYFGRLYGLAGAALEEGVAWALDVAGLAERAGERVRGFSGGMKRRLNLAAGILHRPALVVLDEPTVGVDPQSRRHIFDAVRALRDTGVGVIYTSHYMEEVEALCDRVAVMDHGRVVAAGTTAALVAAHGGGGELVIALAPPADPAAAAAAIGAHGVVTVDGLTLRVAPRAGLAPVLAALEALPVAIASVATRQANLEAVFLSLTGHRLRDD